MTNEQQRQKAIAAVKSGVLTQKIVIHTDADITPKGKRKARMVKVSTSPFAGRYAVSKGVEVIRLYVSGAIYHQMELTVENVKLAKEWVNS